MCRLADRRMRKVPDSEIRCYRADEIRRQKAFRLPLAKQRSLKFEYLLHGGPLFQIASLSLERGPYQEGDAKITFS